MKCPICAKHRSSANWRSERTLKRHMGQEHTFEELLEWGKAEFKYSEETGFALRLEWKFKVFEWLWKKWKEKEGSASEKVVKE